MTRAPPPTGQCLQPRLADDILYHGGDDARRRASAGRAGVRDDGGGTVMLVPYLLGIAAAGSTYAGGRLAMQFGRRRDLLFGLTGGMVVGLALLDLLPEAVEGGGSASEWVFGAVAIGMALYILLHRLPGGAMVGRVSLALHSLMDGLGIGFAFQVSQSTGWLVAAAVLAHDMADGANMIGISSTACRPERAHRWLIANAAAPGTDAACRGGERTLFQQHGQPRASRSPRAARRRPDEGRADDAGKSGRAMDADAGQRVRGAGGVRQAGQRL